MGRRMELHVQCTDKPVHWVPERSATANLERSSPADSQLGWRSASMVRLYGRAGLIAVSACLVLPRSGEPG